MRGASLIITFLGLFISVQGLKGQCQMAERCCQGRDSSCVVNGLQTNGQYVDEPCYCDEGCLETGDCCHDYKQICKVHGEFYFILLTTVSVLKVFEWVKVCLLTSFELTWIDTN